MRIPAKRECPKCGNSLYIDVKTMVVSCFKCGFTEPCHLRGKTPSEKNCKGCPYNPKTKKKPKQRITKKLERTLRQINSMRNFLGLAGKLKLPKKEKEYLKYPSLRGKCYQAWNEKKRTKEIRKWEGLDL